MKTFTLRDLGRRASALLDVCDSEGTVRIQRRDGRQYIISPEARRGQKPHYRLSDLLAGITPDNVHPEMDWGPSRGKEILRDEGEN
jgi:antitoxin component of MazEF toxin-antitoxin module